MTTTQHTIDNLQDVAAALRIRKGAKAIVTVTSGEDIESVGGQRAVNCSHAWFYLRGHGCRTFTGVETWSFGGLCSQPKTGSVCGQPIRSIPISEREI
jgi:hypothetical protein